MRNISSRGPNDIVSTYCLRERILDFQNMYLGEAFLKTWKYFIPRREMRSLSSRGPIVFTYDLFGLGIVYKTFKTCI